MIVGTNKKKIDRLRQKEPTGAHEPQKTNEQFILQSIEGRDQSGAATFIEFLRDELNQPYTMELAL